MKRTILFLWWVVFVLSCSPSTRKEALGEIIFKVTGNEAANAHFIKGLLLMHSFEYDDAAEAFRQAKKEDPSCVMAYWGEAMTYNHPVWQQQDYEKGKAALAELGSTHEERIEKGSTDLEKDFLMAADILYGEGTKLERDKAYSNFMGSLYEKYPGNHEIASLYALSLLGSVAVGRNDEVYGRSAVISEKILKENPNHPGALHYLIHADDDPMHATEALAAANEYSVVAPDASHALHMPTHIFVALGMWDKVIALNEKSWQSSVERKERKQLTNDDLGYHSFHWLEYGYLQSDRVDDARRLLNEMMKYCDELPSSRARTHEVLMRSTFLVETEEWASSPESDTTDVKDMNVYIFAREMFTRGMRCYNRGDIDGLEKIISRMNDVRKIESATVNSDGIAMCKSGSLNTTQLDIDQAFVMESELRGLSAWTKKNYAEAEQWLTNAVATEERISYSFGPPSIVKPSPELYGEFLLDRDRAEEAIEAFNSCLVRAPKRRLALRGKLEALETFEHKGVGEAEKETVE